MEKFDCFAYGTLANSSKGCSVLTDCVCSSGECPFYKTKAQIKEEKRAHRSSNKKALRDDYKEIFGTQKEC